MIFKKCVEENKLLKHFLCNLVCVEFPVQFAEFHTERYAEFGVQGVRMQTESWFQISDW